MSARPRPVPQLSQVRHGLFLQLCAVYDGKFQCFPYEGCTLYSLAFLGRAPGQHDAIYTARTLRDLFWAVHQCCVWRRMEDAAWLEFCGWYSSVRNSDWLEAQATASELNADEAAADSLGSKTPHPALQP